VKPKGLQTRPTAGAGSTVAEENGLLEALVGVLEREVGERGEDGGELEVSQGHVGVEHGVGIDLMVAFWGSGQR